MIEKNQILPYTLAILATAAVVHQAMKGPEIVEATKVVVKTVEVVKYKDRVKVVTRVETRPDGTKIEEETRDETRSGSETKKGEKSKDTSKTVVARLPSYSLSILCDIRSCANFTSYSAVAGFRLGQLPLSLELGGGINGILVGVKYDF